VRETAFESPDNGTSGLREAVFYGHPELTCATAKVKNDDEDEEINAGKERKTNA